MLLIADNEAATSVEKGTKINGTRGQWRVAI